MKRIQAVFAMATSLSATALPVAQAAAQTPGTMPEVAEAPAVPNPKLPGIAAVVYQIGDVNNPTTVQCGVDRDNSKTTIPGESITVITKLTNGMYYVDIDSTEKGESKALVDGKRVITSDDNDPTKIVEKSGKDADIFISRVAEGKKFCATYMDKYVMRYNSQIPGGIRPEMGFKPKTGDVYRLMTFIAEPSVPQSSSGAAPATAPGSSGPG